MEEKELVKIKINNYSDKLEYYELKISEFLGNLTEEQKNYLRTLLKQPNVLNYLRNSRLEKFISELFNEYRGYGKLIGDITVLNNAYSSVDYFIIYLKSGNSYWLEDIQKINEIASQYDLEEFFITDMEIHIKFKKSLIGLEEER